MNREARIVSRVCRWFLASRMEPPPKMVAPIMKLVKEWVKEGDYANKEFGRLRWNLAGWKYRDVVKQSPNYRQTQKELGILLAMVEAERGPTDVCDYSNGVLTIRLPAGRPAWQYDYADIRDSIEHELIHYGQDILQTALGSEGAGLPSRKVRQPDVTQHLDRYDPMVKKLRKEGITPSLFHDLDDVEFYTELNAAIKEVRRVMDGVEPDERRGAFDVLVGLAKRKGWVRPIPFLQALRKGAASKWKKAVGELAKEVL